MKSFISEINICFEMFSNYKIEKFYAEIYEFILNKIKDNQNFKSLRINVFGSVYDNSKIFPYWKDFKSINEILEIIKPLDCGQCIFFDGYHCDKDLFYMTCSGIEGFKKFDVIEKNKEFDK